MKRREFIVGAGSSLAISSATRAQSSLPLVGWMHGGSASPNAHLVEAFRAGMAETGFVEGRNARVDYRWADGAYEKFDEFAVNFVARKVAVIAAVGNASAAFAALKATSAIPIVFANAADPVEIGLVKSINRPSGNATGVTYFTSLMGPKRLEILGEIIPGPAKLGLLVNPRNLITPTEVTKFQDAARALKRDLALFEATNEADIDEAFSRAARDGVKAMLVNTDVYYTSLRDQIVAIAMKHRIAAAYHIREFADAGGLMSYGDKRPAEYRDVGRYVGKILGGAKVSELPVLQPAVFELVVNLKTAKALGLNIPESFLVRADEVIE